MKKVSFSLNELAPCTEYRVDIESVSVNDDQRISSTPTTLNIVTDHARRIDVIPFPEHEEIAFAVLLDGTDCLAEYTLLLCDFSADRTCDNRTVVNTGNVTFEGCEAKHLFDFKVVRTNVFWAGIGLDPRLGYLEEVGSCKARE